MATSLFALPFFISITCADTTIRVVRKDNGPPVQCAKVLIETVDKNFIDQGITDKNGVFVSKKLPDCHKVVSITIYAPAKSDLQGRADDYDVGRKIQQIMIQLEKEIK
jgi:hypothetical protein